MTSYKSPTNIPDELHRLTGIIATHWEWAEFGIDHLVASCSGKPLNEVGLLITNIGFYQKLDLIKLYSRVLEPEKFKQLTAGIETVIDAYKLRNKYVHALWRFDEETKTWGIAIVRTRGGKLTNIIEPANPEQMALDAQTIFDTANTFMALLASFGLPIPWHDKPEQPSPDLSQPAPGHG